MPEKNPDRSHAIKPGTPLGGHDTAANNYPLKRENHLGVITDGWRSTLAVPPLTPYKSKRDNRS